MNLKINNLKKFLNKRMIFLKYVFASGISFVTDLGLFKLFLSFMPNLVNKIFVATVLARILSSFLNYFLNKNSVFEFKKENGIDIKSLVKYYSLVIVQMMVSATLVTLIFNITKGNELIIKGIVDIFIFVVNYFVQKIFIFKKER